MLLLSSDENVVNLDNVTQVARDCLLARMEAIILQVDNKLGYEILDRVGMIINVHCTIPNVFYFCLI